MRPLVVRDVISVAADARGVGFAYIAEEPALRLGMPVQVTVYGQRITGTLQSYYVRPYTVLGESSGHAEIALEIERNAETAPEAAA